MIRAYEERAISSIHWLFCSGPEGWSVVSCESMRGKCDRRCKLCSSQPPCSSRFRLVAQQVMRSITFDLEGGTIRAYGPSSGVAETLRDNPTLLDIADVSLKGQRSDHFIGVRLSRGGTTRESDRINSLGVPLSGQCSTKSSPLLGPQTRLETLLRTTLCLYT